jgi:hypothetical protein
MKTDIQIIYKVTFINAVMAVVVALCFLPLSAFAAFSSGATAGSNSFGIGTLDFTVSNDSYALSIGNNSPDMDIVVSDTGSIQPIYEMTTSQGSCPDSFYKNIDVVVTKGVGVYDGALETMLATSTTNGSWNLAFTASSSLTVYAGEICTVDIAISAWQPIFSDDNYGFSAQQIVNVTFTADSFLGQTVVLNEVLPNPTGSNWQDGFLGEWVELFNNTDQAIDLINWSIKDAAGNVRTIGTPAAGTTTTPGGQTVIPAYGWLVVFMNAAVLDNGGDIVSLYNSSNVLQDQYSYGTGDSGVDPLGTTPDESNGSATTTISTSASGTEGKSDARVPDGIGNWVDPVPTAGGPNILSEDELIALGYSQEQIDFILARQEVLMQYHQDQQEQMLQQEILEQETDIASTSPQTVISDSISTSTATSTMSTTTPETSLPADISVSSTTASSTEEKTGSSSSSVDVMTIESKETSFGFVSDTQGETGQSQDDEQKTQDDADSSGELSKPEVGKEPETKVDPVPESAPEVTNNQTT